MTLLNNVRIYGSFVEQPKVIQTVGKYAAWIGGAGGIGAITGMDVMNAPPEERQKVLKRDALVLGATALGTWAAAKKFMTLPTDKNATDAVEHFVDEMQEGLGTLKKPEAYTALKAELESLRGQVQLKTKDFRNIITTIEKHSETAKEDLAKLFEPEETFPGWREKGKELIQSADYRTGKEEGELRKMGNFFVVGGLSVISGLLGGVAANKVNGVKDKNATVNMIKEGVFQFIANIALCAVGAASAILLMAPYQEFFSKLGWTGKGLKTVGILGGLSLGIFGGGVIANKLGTHVINPLCDKLQGKAPQPVTDPNQGKRKIEFWDAILHLDDVPTAMALAGLEIVEPFIPLFFAFSGYRTGIGYRNDDSAKGKKAPAQAMQQASVNPPIPMQPAMAQANPFAPNPALVQQNQTGVYA